MSGEIAVRHAAQEDLEYIFSGCAEVYDILERCGNMFSMNPESMREILKVRLRSDMSLMIVAESGDERCGFMTADILKPERRFQAENMLVGRMNELYVSQAFRSRGIARILVAECEKWLREGGVSVIQTETFNNNEPSIRFWDSYNDYLPLTQRRYKKV